MRAAVLALAVCAACGRIGFSREGGSASDGGGDGDGSAGDATADAPDTVIDAAVYVAPAVGGFDSRFGYSVALSADGTTLAVGAWGEGNHAGAVFVYVRSGGAWTLQATLVADNREANDVFGYEVAISATGDVLVIGAPDEDGGATSVNGDGTDNSKPSAGAAYVFVRSGTSWAQQAYLKPTAIDASDNFGCAVAIDASGAAVAIGAYTEDAPGLDPASNALPGAGAAYVFERSGTTWSQQAFLKAPNAGTDDSFGVAIALSGDGTRVAVAATGEASNATGIGGNGADDSLMQAGAVYVFARVAAAWPLEAYVKASNTDGGDFFGYDVALSSDGRTLAVSAEGEDGLANGVNGPQQEGAGQAGAAYVFERTSSWAQVAYVKATNTEADDRFGRSIALSGDALTLVVGAALEDSGEAGIGGTGGDDSSTDSGAAYVYRRGSTGWAPLTRLKATNTAAGDQFGAGTAISANGSRIAIGAFARDAGAMDSGAVYVFD
jgi:hypothetical protein